MKIKLALLVVYLPLLGPLAFVALPLRLLDWICLITVAWALGTRLVLAKSVLEQKTNDYGSGFYFFAAPGLFFVLSSLFLFL
jgi:hypothetical protein